ncbi:hypothetical protein BGX27_008019 [Mortierella sp. AM989]|nr:hypothetical protein BGX27_008019 [Mortierella sp. AM989]
MDSIKSSFFSSSRRKSLIAPKTTPLQQQQQQQQQQLQQQQLQQLHQLQQQQLQQQQQQLQLLQQTLIHQEKMDSPRLDLDSSSFQEHHQQQPKAKPPPLRKIPVRDFESYSPPPIMTAPIYGSTKLAPSSPPPYYPPQTNINGGNTAYNNGDTNGHQNDYYRSYQNQESSYISSTGQAAVQDESQQRQQNYIGTATGGSGNSSISRGDRDREREGGPQGYRSHPASQYQLDPSSLASLPSNSTPASSSATMTTSKTRRPKSLATHEFTGEGGNGSSSLLLGNDGSLYSLMNTNGE